MKYRLSLICLFTSCCSLFTNALIAQNIMQTLRGRLTDAASLQGVATVNVVAATPTAVSPFQTQTDDNGNYTLHLPVGNYKLTFSSVGYEEKIADIVIEAGKETVLDWQIKKQGWALQEILITDQADKDPTLLELSKNELLRAPSNLQDPARLLTLYAGAATANDQANHISYRGNDPALIGWYINGLEVITPNHLTNAGTLNDRPNATGGGVHILSTQVLQNALFSGSAQKPAYTNAAVGVLDLQTRHGNSARMEANAQVSLIGTDILLEGPTRLSKNSSFLANYRYSTLGLLGKLGVNLGDEKITYQDATAVFYQGFEKGGLQVFGTWGNSGNVFAAKSDSTQIKSSKDFHDITYSGEYRLLGANGNAALGKQWLCTFGTAYSAGLNDYEIYRPNRNRRYETTLNHEKWNTRVQLERAFSKRLSVQVGAKTLWQRLDDRAANTTPGRSYYPTYAIKQNFWTTDLHAGIEWRVGKFFDLQPGIVVRRIGDDTYVEPRLHHTIHFSPHFKLYHYYSINHQYTRLREVYVDFFQGTVPRELPNWTVAAATHHGAGVQYQRQTWVAKVAFFTARIKTPKAVNSFSRRSLLNDQHNKGVEASFQKQFDQQYYVLANVSLFDNTDAIFNATQTPYSVGYVSNLTAGKEWERQRSTKTTIWGIGTRFTYRGGGYVTPIFDVVSQYLEFTYFDYTHYNSVQLAPYWKIDLRAYCKWNRARYGSMLSLDLLNVLNTQNDAFHYYDWYLQKTVVQQQLGLIPNITYRINFGL